MLKWSQAVLLAFHAMAMLAKTEKSPLTVDDMASSLGVSSDHLAKVMQKLSHSGLVKSVRGPNGGYSLDVNPSDTYMMSIYESIDGPYVARECEMREQGCGGCSCIFGDMIGDVNRVVFDYLTKTTLSDAASR